MYLIFIIIKFPTYQPPSTANMQIFVTILLRRFLWTEIKTRFAQTIDFCPLQAYKIIKICNYLLVEGRLCYVRVTQYKNLKLPLSIHNMYFQYEHLHYSH